MTKDSFLAVTEMEMRLSMFGKKKEENGEEIEELKEEPEETEGEEEGREETELEIQENPFPPTPSILEEVGEECQEEIKILIGYMNHTLKQNILTSIEQEDYVHQMEALCEQLYENAREKLEVIDYSFLLQRLIEQKFYEEAEKWAERFMTQYPDELKPYTLCMKLYFEMEQKEKFFEVLDKLRASSIVIDNQTLELIRIVQR